MVEPERTKVRYDDFIGNVHADPANPQLTILLSGFIGHGAAEGTTRIYPDPSLGTWYDVPETDIVHTLPIPDAPLGGSYVWVKSSAQITPGSASAAPAAPAPAAAGAAAPAGAWPTHAASLCFLCGAAPHGPQAAGLGAAAAAHMQAADSPILCTRINCPMHTILCECTDANFCSWFDCTGRAVPAAAQQAQQAQGMPLTMHLSWCICNAAALCALGTGAPPPPANHTRGTVCTIPSLVGCTTFTLTLTTPLLAGGGPGGMGAGVFNPLLAAAAAPGPAAAQPTPTAATHCFICPPHQTLATLCTQLCTQPAVGCPPPTLTQPVFCGILPPSVGCPQGGQPQAMAAAAQPAAAAAALPHTLALCTQGFPTFCGCTPGIDCAPGAGGGLQTNPAVCTQGLATFCGCTPGLACMPAAQAAAFQPTPSAVTLCCVAGQAAPAAMQPTPTAATHCFICPPHVTPFCTLATICTFPGICPPRTGVFTPFGG